MDIVERARSIILNPGPTWQVIEQEPVASPQSLYVPYMVILAAIPAVASFVGLCLVGVGFGFRIPIVTGLSIMVTQYVLALVATFVWGWLVNALAGNFGGQSNMMNALKLTVYGSTPGMVAGVLHVIPSLGLLAVLGSLYGLYVIYLGLPVLMKNPPDKTVPYMAVVVVVGIVCMFVVATVSSVLMPSPLGRMGHL